MSTMEKGDEAVNAENNCNNVIINEKDCADNLNSFNLDETLHMLFTGYFNGFSIEIRSIGEMSLLHSMGCFGKESFSHSSRNTHIDDHKILRKRQYNERIMWYKKFKDNKENAESHKLLKEIEELTASIISERSKNENKDVIDLVSSGDSESDSEAATDESLICMDQDEIVVVVPNSDSEGDDYFENFKPECRVNRVRIDKKLILSLQEAYYLIYTLECLQIINSDSEMLSVEQCWNLFNEVDTNFIQKYIVYHYYKSKGYIVKPAIKFGGDYLLYKKAPGVDHSLYIILIKYSEEKYKLDWYSVLGHVRVATTTAKDVILAEVIKDDKRTPDTPHDLTVYTVLETLLKRKNPVELKEDTD